MNKVRAIERVSSDLGHALLNHANAAFANVNAARPVWWFNIDLRKFGNDLHLHCAGNPGLVWLKFDAGTFRNPQGTFRSRRDNGRIELESSCDVARYMRDVKSAGIGYDFRPHVQREWA